MRNLLKFLLIILFCVPFSGFAQGVPLKSDGHSFFLPGCNLDILTTAHMLGYTFKWYQQEFEPTAFQDTDPRVVAAHGIPQSGSASSDKEVTQWVFHSALISLDQQTVYTIETKFENGLFSPVTLEKKPWGGVEIGKTSLAGEVKLPLDEVIDRMKMAGFTHPFTMVDIYKPLYPPAKTPIYAFYGVVPGKTVFVNAVSGEVSTWPPTPLINAQ